MKNWIISTTVIIIDEDHNDVTITLKRGRMRAATISMIWNQLLFWVEKSNVQHTKNSNNDV